MSREPQQEIAFTTRPFLLDPRTGLFLTVTVSCILISGGTQGPMLYNRLFLSSLPLLLMLWAGKTPAALKYAALILASLACRFLIVPHLHGAAFYLVNGAVGLVSHMMPGMFMGYILMATTEVGAFIAAMERLRLPQSVIITFSVIFRFFPTVREEAEAIGWAMRMRGITPLGTLKNPVAALEYCLVPLMVSVVKIGEELTQSALTRGLGSPRKRTSLCEVGLRWHDVVLSLPAIAAWAVFAADSFGGIR